MLRHLWGSCQLSVAHCPRSFFPSAESGSICHQPRDTLFLQSTASPTCLFPRQACYTCPGDCSPPRRLLLHLWRKRLVTGSQAEIVITAVAAGRLEGHRSTRPTGIGMWQIPCSYTGTSSVEFLHDLSDQEIPKLRLSCCQASTWLFGKSVCLLMGSRWPWCRTSLHGVGLSLLMPRCLFHCVPCARVA